MQSDLNTGVYKAGFARDEEAYARNVPPVFAALNKVEKMISYNGGPFILGRHLTEIDVRCKSNKSSLRLFITKRNAAIMHPKRQKQNRLAYIMGKQSKWRNESIRH